MAWVPPAYQYMVPAMEEQTYQYQVPVQMLASALAKIHAASADPVAAADPVAGIKWQVDAAVVRGARVGDEP